MFSKKSMTTLAPRNSIDEEIINYVTRVLIKPGGRNVHTCNCAFVTSLLNADIAAERCDVLPSKELRAECAGKTHRSG